MEDQEQYLNSSIEELLTESGKVLRSHTLSRRGRRLTNSACNESVNSLCGVRGVCSGVLLKQPARCRCGELPASHALSRLHWSWRDRGQEEVVKFHHTHVQCHHSVSRGTAVLIGDTALRRNCLHYFEVKFLSRLYGTDVMVGLCTESMLSRNFSDVFVSALGTDNESWGFSYHGRRQNGGVLRQYGGKFSRGSIVGVYVDMTVGSVEFFINRVSLGVAYSNLLSCGGAIYPAVSTTAADTTLRLVMATSVANNLQFACARSIVANVPYFRQCLSAPLLRIIDCYPWLQFVNNSCTQRSFLQTRSPTLSTYHEQPGHTRAIWRHKQQASMKKTSSCFSQPTKNIDPTWQCGESLSPDVSLEGIGGGDVAGKMSTSSASSLATGRVRNKRRLRICRDEEETEVDGRREDVVPSASSTLSVRLPKNTGATLRNQEVVIPEQNDVAPSEHTTKVRSRRTTRRISSGVSQSGCAAPDLTVARNPDIRRRSKRLSVTSVVKPGVRSGWRHNDVRYSPRSVMLKKKNLGNILGSVGGCDDGSDGGEQTVLHHHQDPTNLG